MKNRIAASLFLSLLFFVTPFAHAFAALESHPTARSPRELRGRFDTDLFTGGAVYSYPVTVPKGTDDLTPAVSLSYNSLGARDFNTYAGIGWQLSRDYIERDVNFTPTNTGDDKFKLHFKGSVYDLVFVPTENRFHTKIESFLHIQRLSGGQNQLGDYWQIITPDGTKYRFGFQSQSELLCNGQNHVSNWNLDQVEDTHGNKIFSTYTENSGAVYLTKIEYNTDKTRVIEFGYTTNPYNRQAVLQGCFVTDPSRLTTITITAGSPVRSYALTYSTAANDQPLLATITEKGSDGSALPPTAFTYKPEIHTWQTTSEKWLDNADVDVNLQNPNARIMDVNGDGFVDIVKSIPDGGDATWRVLFNTGSAWSTTWQTWVNDAPIDAHIAHAQVRLVDVTGDSLPDIVKGAGSTWRVFRNTGSSWNTTGEVWANDAIFPNLAEARIGMADVTGDGLTDIVRTGGGGPTSIWECM
jgi:virulence plasmid B protein